MPEPTDYCIRHYKDPELWWNNEDGWVGPDCATVFTPAERQMFRLPMEGVWYRPVPPENAIGTYIHCGECIKELPHDQSPSEYARFECGWTPIGVQIRCTRHNLNVVHIDFEGVRHPANIDG